MITRANTEKAQRLTELLSSGFDSDVLPEGLHARSADDPARIEILDAQGHVWVTIHNAAQGDPETWRWTIRDRVCAVLDVSYATDDDPRYAAAPDEVVMDAMRDS